LLKTLWPRAVLGKDLWDFSISTKNTLPGIAAKRFGQGKVILFNRPLHVYNMNTDLKKQMTQALTGSLQQLVKADVKEFRSVIRVDKDGSYWLAVNNTDVSRDMRATVTLQGAFPRACDVTIPGWLSVKTKVVGDQTTLKINLRPGDWTVIKLQK
jgi:hypothetical protein